jgi:hypothetical protein
LTVSFRRESLTDALWSEMQPLLAAHWREIAHFQDIPLEPDREFYRAAERADALRVFTAYTTTGFAAVDHLVGYAAYFVKHNPHYASSLQAVQDVVYLDPSVRGGTGYRFIAWCDDQLRAEGVQVVIHHVKAAHNWGKVLERQGYKAVDVLYAKRLDGPRSIVRRDEAAD